MPQAQNLTCYISSGRNCPRSPRGVVPDDYKYSKMVWSVAIPRHIELTPIHSSFVNGTRPLETPTYRQAHLSFQTIRKTLQVPDDCPVYARMMEDYDINASDHAAALGLFASSPQSLCSGEVQDLIHRLQRSFIQLGVAAVYYANRREITKDMKIMLRWNLIGFFRWLIVLVKKRQISSILEDETCRTIIYSTLIVTNSFELSLCGLSSDEQSHCHQMIWWFLNVFGQELLAPGSYFQTVEERGRNSSPICGEARLYWLSEKGRGVMQILFAFLDAVDVLMNFPPLLKTVTGNDASEEWIVSLLSALRLSPLTTRRRLEKL